ncbi:MAG: hypothetical protein LBB21_03925 [Holosporaceae bacterium]|jgi:hypothetical protein|nr:hypothetical protein [Holosporaceae bacterium]
MKNKNDSVMLGIEDKDLGFEIDQKGNVSKKSWFRIRLATVIAIGIVSDCFTVNPAQLPRYNARSYWVVNDQSDVLDGSFDNPGIILWTKGTITINGVTYNTMQNDAYKMEAAFNKLPSSEDVASEWFNPKAMSRMKNAKNVAFAGIELIIGNGKGSGNDKIFDYVRFPNNNVSLFTTGTTYPPEASDTIQKIGDSMVFQVIDRGVMIDNNGTEAGIPILTQFLKSGIAETCKRLNVSYKDTEGQIIKELLSPLPAGNLFLANNISRLAAGREKEIKIIVLHVFTRMDPCKICAKALIAFSKEMNSIKTGTQFFNYIRNNINAQLLDNLIKGKCGFLIIVHAGEEYTTAGQSVHAACIPNMDQDGPLWKNRSGNAIILRRWSIGKTTCTIHDK